MSSKRLVKRANKPLKRTHDTITRSPKVKKQVSDSSSESEEMTKTEEQKAIAVKLPKQQVKYIQNTRVSIVTKPSVSIYNINPSAMMAKYKRGEYKKYPSFLDELTIEGLVDDGPKLLEEQNCTSSTNQTPICIRKDVNGVSSRYVTTNNDAYADKPGGHCLYCRRQYKGISFGYPIRPAIYKNDQVFYFVDDRSLCSPECILAYLNYINIPSQKRINYIKYSKDMLEVAYNLTDISPAKSFKLLKINGGTESYEDWSNPDREYRSTGTVVIYPIKHEFQVLEYS